MAISDAADLCAPSLDPGQGDRDRDRIGDACDRAAAQATSRRARARAPSSSDVRGEVVRQAAGAGRPRARQAAEFVPLKGVASLPDGHDRRRPQGLARRWSRRPTAGPPPTGGAARSRRGSPPGSSASARPGVAPRVEPAPSRRHARSRAHRGAERACARSTRARPLKRTSGRIVTSKGFFRAVGGASVGTSQNGTWITTRSLRRDAHGGRSRKGDGPRPAPHAPTSARRPRAAREAAGCSCRSRAAPPPGSRDDDELAVRRAPGAARPRARRRARRARRSTRMLARGGVARQRA